MTAQYLEEIDRKQTEGLFQEAYQLILQYEDELALTLDVNELKHEVRQYAQGVIDESREKLDLQFQREVRHFNLEVASQALEQWENASIGGPDTELDSYRRRFDAQRIEHDKIVLYDSTYQQIQDLWNRAQEESQRNASTRVLKEIYERAYTIARDAAVGHEDNPYLQELFQSTRARRERMAVEEEAMTSGALAGQYVKTLVFVLYAEENDYILVVDQYGAQKGRFKRDQARQEVEESARAFVDTKLVQYMDDARARLRGFRPLEAQAALAEYHKFLEPVDPGFNEEVLRGAPKKWFSLDELVPTLIRANRLRDIDQLEGDIQQGLEQWRSAEMYAKSVLEWAESDIAEAWLNYQAALEAYEGATSIEAVIEARDKLEKTTRNNIDAYSSQIDALLQQRRLPDAEQLAANGLEMYRAMERELRLESKLRKLEQVSSNIRVVRDSLKSIRASLDDGNYDEAAVGLRKLQQDSHNRRYYEADPQYDDIEAETTRRQSESAELERLQGFLTNSNRNRVEGALIAAQEAANEGTPYSQKFDELALQLEAHLMDIDLDRQLAETNYEVVIERLTDVLQRFKGLASASSSAQTLHTRLENRLEEMYTRSQEVETDRANLSRAQELLSKGNAKDAYEILSKIKKFATDDERRKRDHLLNDARDTRIRQLQNELHIPDIKTSFDRMAKDQCLRELEDLDYDMAQRARQQHRLYDGAQIARDYESAGDLKQALDVWEGLAQQASWQDATYVRQQIAQINKRMKEAEINDLLEPGERGQNEKEFAEWIGRLIAVSKELAQLANNSRERIERIQFMVWRIWVMLAHAQYTPDLRTRRELLNDVYDVARTLETLVAALDVRQLDPYERDVVAEVERILPLAQVGPEIGEAMREVEEHLNLDVDIALFRQAVQRWESFFTPYAQQLPALDRWYKDGVRQVQAQIRAELHEQAGDNQENYADLTPVTLPLYAKLLILDDADPGGTWMLSQLARLSSEIDQQVDELSASIFASEGIPPGQAQQTLQNKLEQVVDYLNNVRLIHDLLELFTYLRALRDQGSSLIEMCGNQIEKLRFAQKRLQQFITVGRDFETFVKNYEPRDDGQNSWHHFESEFREAWRELEIQIRDIDDDLTEHPWIAEELRAQFDRRLTDLRGLIRHLVNIQTMMQEEAFEEADQQAQAVQNNPVYQKAFSRMLLYGEYRVTDVWAKREVVGWESAYKLVEKRKSCFDVIYNWARLFDAPDRVPPQALNRDISPTPATRVIRWADEYQRVMAEKRKGDFNAARDLIQCALTGEGEHCTPDLLPLEEALRIASEFPVAENRGESGDYNTARAHAGSERGQQIVDWMERYRRQCYADEINQANSTIRVIVQAEADWKRELENFTGVLRSIDETLDMKLHGKAKRQRLLELINAAQNYLGKLRAICPQHPSLDNLDRHQVLLEATKEAK